MSERLLEVRDLRVSFATRQGTVRAVRGVSFHVGAGEILGFVGESGSGKSVSVLSCMGLLARNGRIDGGSILFEGKELSPVFLTTREQQQQRENELRRLRGGRIGMIFQDPMTYINPVLTIGTQLTEGMRAHKSLSRKEARARAVELMRLVEIPDPERRMRQYPYEFSGGMRQRILIAAALSCDPKLLIADEPTTALDVTVQAQILDLIRRRAREAGTAVILITHDLGVVASLCDRIAILYGGKIAETGTTDDIFYRAKHPYTRGLLLSVAARRADSAGAGGYLPSISGSPPDLLRINSGCPFAARCDSAMKICRDYMPVRRTFGKGHSASCWLYCRDSAAEIAAVQDRKRGDARV